jgi:hypothetical protein
MDFNLLFNAFGTVMLNPANFFFVFIGITSGIIVGALPGLTATMGCALLIPFTFGLPPIQGLLMLMGIFCGGIYGGSIDRDFYGFIVCWRDNRCHYNDISLTPNRQDWSEIWSS